MVQISCPRCRTEVLPNALNCPRCGEALTDEPVTMTMDPARIAHNGNSFPRAPRATSRPVSRAFLSVVVAVPVLLLVVLLFVLGLWPVAMLLLVLVLIAGLVLTRTSWQEIEDQVTQGTEDAGARLTVWVRIARVSLVSWSEAGKIGLTAGLKKLRIRRQHDRLLRSLGEAVYAGDETRAHALKESAALTGSRIDEYQEEVQSARIRASERVSLERRASEPTQALSVQDLAAINSDIAENQQSVSSPLLDGQTTAE